MSIKLDGTGRVSCQVADFGISKVGPFDYTTIVSFQ